MMSSLSKVLLSLICFCVCLNPLFALEEADKTAVLAIVQGYTEAWNQHGGRGFGEGFSEDADFVNIYGMHFSGKKEIEERHIAILSRFLKGSLLIVQDIRLREVHPGLIVALVCWKLDGYRAPGEDISVHGELREGIFTQVFVKGEQNWQITASQNTLKPFQIL